MSREKKDTFCVVNSLIIEATNTVGRRDGAFFHFEDFRKFVEQKLKWREEQGEDWSLEKDDILEAVLPVLRSHVDRGNFGRKGD